MGIRFFCPNGHRLNVKSFLAGKRGVCPDCGTRVNIPMESDASAVLTKKTRASGADSANGNGHHSATAVLDEPESAPAEEAHDDFRLPASLEGRAAGSVPPAKVTTHEHVFETVKPAAPSSDKAVRPPSSRKTKADAATPIAAKGTAEAPSGIPLPGAAAAAPPPVPAPTPPGPPDVTDPIAEAPHSVWYVRPSAGGQYGPARGDVMRKWLAEGRVTADSIVWREGWTDWRPAGKVFPDLGPGTASAPGHINITPVIPEVPRRPIRPQRKKTSASGIGIVVALGIVCLGLLMALVYMLMSSGSPTPAP